MWARRGTAYPESWENRVVYLDPISTLFIRVDNPRYETSKEVVFGAGNWDLFGGDGRESCRCRINVGVNFNFTRFKTDFGRLTK
jgi:hypothetical protein